MPLPALFDRSSHLLRGDIATVDIRHVVVDDLKLIIDGGLARLASVIRNAPPMTVAAPKRSRGSGD